MDTPKPSPPPAHRSMTATVYLQLKAAFDNIDLAGSQIVVATNAKASLLGKKPPFPPGTNPVEVAGHFIARGAADSHGWDAKSQEVAEVLFLTLMENFGVMLQCLKGNLRPVGFGDGFGRFEDIDTGEVVNLPLPVGLEPVGPKESTISHGDM